VVESAVDRKERLEKNAVIDPSRSYIGWSFVDWKVIGKMPALKIASRTRQGQMFTD